MKQGLIIVITLFFSLRSFSLEGIAGLEQKLFEKNKELLARQSQIEADEASYNSSNSAYYPTLNAVGGWGQNKIDDLIQTEKGYMGYLEGKFNLFRGFKDQTFIDQKDITLKISKVEFEAKKRKLRLELTEFASNMVYLHKLQGILQDEYNVTQNQKKMAAKKVSAGLTGSVDNYEFELRESEIEIQQKQINQQHLEAHQNLFKIFGEDVTDQDIDRLDFSSIEVLTKIKSQQSLEKSLEYQKAQLLQDQVELQKKEIKSDFLPSIDFTYSAGRLTPSEIAPIELNESKYALMVTIPLFSGFDTYYKTKAAVLLSQSIEKLKIQKANEVKSDFNISINKMSEFKSLFDINEKKMNIAKKYFDLTLAEYRRGIKNSPDLVSATERLFSTKKKKYELLKDIESLKIKIESF